MSKILVTGGAGFIGSHCCVELLEGGYDVVVMDNLCNSKLESIHRIETITGKTVTFYQTDYWTHRVPHRFSQSTKLTRSFILQDSRRWANPWESRWNIITTT